MTLSPTSPWSDGFLPTRHLPSLPAELRAAATPSTDTPAPASPLASLMAALQARIAVLYARQQAPHAAPDASPTDVGRAIWTLHVLGNAYSALSQLNCARIPQPEQVVEQLQQLADSLLSMATAVPDATKPVTTFRNASAATSNSDAAAFARVDALVRTLLARAPGAEPCAADLACEVTP